MAAQVVSKENRDKDKNCEENGQVVFEGHDASVKSVKGVDNKRRSARDYSKTDPGEKPEAGYSKPWEEKQKRTPLEQNSSANDGVQKVVASVH